VEEHEEQARFEACVMPHLDAAYNLARWLTRNEHDAQDVVQDAFLRALKFFGGFRGGSSRSWLLSIVRNTCYSWLEKNRKREFATAFDEDLHAIADNSHNPEILALRDADRQTVRLAVEQLPVEFREVIVLRELEEMSYKEIAEIEGVPIGTVMSRLARARKMLHQCLARRLETGSTK
jgi:RNA polymerase sigma factor (sigma-70 family)